MLLRLVAGAGRRVPNGRRPAQPQLSPLSELRIAVVAGAAGDPTRVEVCVLIQGHLQRAVLVAEDVATFATVVPAREVTEGALAGSVVAHS
jgi:hypothetical protein